MTLPYSASFDVTFLPMQNPLRNFVKVFFPSLMHLAFINLKLGRFFFSLLKLVLEHRNVNTEFAHV